MDLIVIMVRRKGQGPWDLFGVFASPERALEAVEEERERTLTKDQFKSVRTTLGAHFRSTPSETLL